MLPHGVINDDKVISECHDMMTDQVTWRNERSPSPINFGGAVNLQQLWAY